MRSFYFELGQFEDDLVRFRGRAVYPKVDLPRGMRVDAE